MPLYLPSVTPFNETIVTTVDPMHSQWMGLFNMSGAGGNLATWPTANLAIFVPIHIWRTLTLRSFVFQRGVASGNCDAGIYRTNFTRIISTGSVAAAGVTQVVDVEDTVLERGQYFLALSYDNTTATTRRITLTNTWSGRMIGMLEQSTAFPLPSTASPAPITAAGTNLRYPYIGFSTNTYGL